ncbi:hypothetical protein [Micromonospora sp. CPCC 206061]|uniref:hypothetical protein n=1 Tax=Micromonospora sp. CPCC 206061 TaxID=3122410 RepID=UPI002FF0319F
MSRYLVAPATRSVPSVRGRDTATFWKPGKPSAGEYDIGLRYSNGPNHAIQYRVDAADTGHVNLDLISIRKPGERVVLFDGGDLSQWQHTDGRMASWPRVADGAMEVRNGDLRTNVDRPRL